MIQLFLISLLLFGDQQVLILKNGKLISCERYEREEGVVRVHLEGQLFTLPEDQIDWARTQAESKRRQAARSRATTAVEPTESDTPQQEPRAPIVLTQENFKSSHKAAKRVTIPFESLGNTMIVDVALNGRGPFRIIVDTGASVTVIDPDIIADLNLQSEATAIRLQGVGGSVESTRIELEELAVGRAVQKNIAVAVHKLEGMDHFRTIGLLGQDFLGRYVVEVDSAAQNISLTPHGAPTAADKMNANISQFEQLIAESDVQKARFQNAMKDLTTIYGDYFKGRRKRDAIQRIASLSADLNSFRSYAGQVKHLFSSMADGMVAEQDRANTKAFISCYPQLEQVVQRTIRLAQLLRRAYGTEKSMRPQLGEQMREVQTVQHSYADCLRI